MNGTHTVDRHVLMLDDESLFLRFFAIPFRTGFCGFCTWHVHEFTDPGAALEFYAENVGKVDVVLTDYLMPRMSGLQFLDAVRAVPTRNGDVVPAIIVSSEPPETSMLPPLTATVAKPFTKDDIARSLCKVSVVCETGKCPHHGGVKPRPDASAFRPLADSASLRTYG